MEVDKSENRFPFISSTSSSHIWVRLLFSRGQISLALAGVVIFRWDGRGILHVKKWENLPFYLVKMFKQLQNRFLQLSLYTKQMWFFLLMKKKGWVLFYFHIHVWFFCSFSRHADCCRWQWRKFPIFPMTWSWHKRTSNSEFLFYIWLLCWNSWGLFFHLLEANSSWNRGLPLFFPTDSYP